MGKKAPLILADKLYIPKHQLQGSLRDAILKKHFSYIIEVGDEMVRRDGYKIGRRYIAVEAGNKKKLKYYFSALGPLKDRRVKPAMGYPLEFTTKLYEEQSMCTTQWLKKRYGILVAPTGWGKTVAVLRILCALGLKALVLVSKKGHAANWVEEIYKHTNAEQLDLLHATRMCGVYSTSDRHVYPCITVATYQSFIHSKSKTWYQEHTDTWGTIWVDEADEAGADVYADVVGTSMANVRGGCTATPRRNDGLEHLVFDIIGPVTSRGKEVTMNAVVTMLTTNVFVPHFNGSKNEAWVKMLGFLSANDRFYDLIKNMLMYDVKHGRHILAVSSRNNVLKDLYADLNDRDDLNGRVALLTGNVLGAARQRIIDGARSGAILITLAQAAICNRAINVPLWDCIHRITPCAGWTRSQGGSNKERRPNTQLTQPTGRILRRLDGKPTPIVRHYVHSGNPMVVGTANSCASAYRYLGHDVRSRLAAEILMYGDDPDIADFIDDD